MSRLDFKTWLYLCITGAKKAKNQEYTFELIDKEFVYIFDSSDDFKAYFENYLEKVDEDVIELAIYTRGKKGEIVALKGLCDHIILRTKVKEFYESITQEKIDEIHSKGKLTPLEMVQVWEANNLCAPGIYVPNSKPKCDFFNYNCHECLIEYASHQLEYDNLDKENLNSIKKEQGLVLKKIRK